MIWRVSYITFTFVLGLCCIAEGDPLTGVIILACSANSSEELRHEQHG